MARLRIEITKGEEIRYISHLDYARAIERSIRRAKLPAAYSEGFNPHMKLAFASALGVGVVSDSEYADIELKEDMNLQEVISSLKSKLPQGVVLKRGKYIPSESTALMAVVNLAVYNIIVPLLNGAECTDVQQGALLFNRAEEVIYIRESPKGRREINVREFVKEVKISQADGMITLEFSTQITPKGTVKPSEVLAALVNNFSLPADRDNALINRIGLYVIDQKGVRLTPLELS